MPTTTADNTAPRTIALDDGGLRDESVLVGPSMRGWIYRSLQGPCWYRVIPMTEVSLEWRHRIRIAPPATAPALITALRDWQQLVLGVPHLIMSYRCDCPGRSLAEYLEKDRPVVRLRAAIACMRALPGWWQALAPPLFPLPSEMILSSDGQVRLLWLPRPQLPDARVAFSDPQRILYLTPELLRSATNIPWDAPTWEAVDRYVIGVSLLECYCQLPRMARPETAMFRAASGSLLNRLPPRDDLPPWLDRFSNHRNTISLLRRLTSSSLETRKHVDLEQLGNRLERLQELFDPRAAVAWLRDGTQPREALDLLQELFPLSEALSIDTDQQYDLLCLAGELCASYLRRSLESLDFYDRAIALGRERREAHQEQLRVIASARHRPALAALLESNSSVAADIDVKLWQNYRFLAAGRTTHADDEDGQLNDRLVARYLLWKRQYDLARDFVYLRLFDAHQTYIWWDFELSLCYVQAFLGLENGDGSNLARAAEQLTQIKDGLNHARQNLGHDPSLLHQYGQELSELEYQIHAAQSGARG